MGTVISYIECSQVAGLIQKLVDDIIQSRKVAATHDSNRNTNIFNAQAYQLVFVFRIWYKEHTIQDSCTGNALLEQSEQSNKSLTISKAMFGAQ